MPPASRGTVALRIGKDIGLVAQQLLQMPADSGPTHIQERSRYALARLTAIDRELGTLVESCRAAKGQYLNYPSVRNAILEAGNQIYTTQIDLMEVRTELANSIEDDTNMEVVTVIARRIALLATRLRMIPFTPTKETVT